MADGLTAPLSIVFSPDRPERRLVLDQVGTVRELTADGISGAEPFLDLRQQIVALHTSSDDERGLLGLAFHPDHGTTRRLVVFRTAPASDPAMSHRNVLSEFRTDRAGRRVDVSTERVLWARDQREPSHAAGQVRFDDQGRLLLFLGDGQDGTAVDPTSVMGKVLRFDLTQRKPVPEIVASGLRHPWRLSYDAPTRQLLFSEPNFTSRYQEVNVFTEGANYGWGLEVPKSCWGATGTEPQPQCLTAAHGTALQPPVAEYGPGLGSIIAGAHLYRGTRLSGLTDRLVAADWGITDSGGKRGGRILYSAPGDGPPYRLQEAAITGLPSSSLWFWSLARDSAGELYLMTMKSRGLRPGQGAVYRFESTEGGSP